MSGLLTQQGSDQNLVPQGLLGLGAQVERGADRVLPGGQHTPRLAHGGGGADRAPAGLPAGGRGRCLPLKAHPEAAVGTGRLASSSPGEAKAGSEGGTAQPSIQGTQGSGRGWRQPVLRLRSPVLSAQGPQPGEGRGTGPPATGSTLVYVCDEQQLPAAEGQGPEDCVCVCTQPLVRLRIELRRVREKRRAKRSLI